MTKPLMTEQERNAELVEQTQAQQIAGLALMGGSEAGIGKQMGLSRHRVRKIMAGEEFKAIMHDLAVKSTDFAVQAFKAKMNALEPLAYAALKQNLEDGKIEAVKVWAGMVGLDRNDEEKAQAPITIVMPGNAPPEAPAIQVVVEPKEGDS